jgi:hypothetical protein
VRHLRSSKAGASRRNASSRCQVKPAGSNIDRVSSRSGRANCSTRDAICRVSTRARNDCSGTLTSEDHDSRFRLMPGRRGDFRGRFFAAAVEPARIGQDRELLVPNKTLDFTRTCGSSNRLVGDTGLEPVTHSLSIFSPRWPKTPKNTGETSFYPPHGRFAIVRTGSRFFAGNRAEPVPKPGNQTGKKWPFPDHPPIASIGPVLRPFDPTDRQNAGTGGRRQNRRARPPPCGPRSDRYSAVAKRGFHRWTNRAIRLDGTPRHNADWRRLSGAIIICTTVRAVTIVESW